MKNKQLASLVLITSCISFNASADTILGGYIGVQTWEVGSEGGFAESENIVDFGFEDENNLHFYAALEHPIPLIPNIKIARTTLDTAGGTNLTSTFEFGGEVFSASTVLDTDVELETTDYILYYEILDMDVASLDLGVNIKQIDGRFFVADTNTMRSAADEFKGFVPMGYARAAVGIPGTGLGAYVEGSVLSVDDSSLVDYQVAVTYSFIETLALDLTIQAGYRSTELDIEDIDDVFADLQFDGAFVGVEFDF